MDDIRWVTTQDMVDELMDFMTPLVLGVFAMADPNCKRLLYTYARVAAQMSQTRSYIRFYALDGAEYPGLETELYPKAIPYPYTLVYPDLGMLMFDSTRHLVKPLQLMFPQELDTLLTEYVWYYHNLLDRRALFFYKTPEELGNVREKLEALASSETQLRFVTVDVTNHNHAHYLDENPKKAPYFVIDEREGQAYGIESPSGEAIQQFVTDYNSGKLKPSFRSEPKPSTISTVVKLVGYTHDEQLTDLSKSFFVRYHRERRVILAFTDARQKWIAIAERFSSDPTIVFAELNLCLNSVNAQEGFCVYPAAESTEAGARKAIEYPSGCKLSKILSENDNILYPWLLRVDAENLEHFLTTHNKVVVVSSIGNCIDSFSSVAKAIQSSHPEIQFIVVKPSDENGSPNGFVIYRNGEKVEQSNECFDLKELLLQTFYPVNNVRDENEWSQLFHAAERTRPYADSVGRPYIALKKPLVVQFNVPESPEFLEIAFAFREDFKFVQLDSRLNAFVAGKYHTTVGDAPTWMVIHAELYGDVRIFSEEMNRPRFEEFLQREKTPLIFVYGSPTKSIQNADNGHAIYFYRNYSELDVLEKDFEELARKYPKLRFGFADLEVLIYKVPCFESLDYLRHLKKSIFVINESLHFVLDPMLSTNTPLFEAIADFVSDFVAAKLKPFQRPEEWLIPVQKLAEFNGVNIEELHKDTSKTFLIWFHEGDEKFEHLESLADHFASNPEVVVGHLEWSNDVDYQPFPYAQDDSYLVLYPKEGAFEKQTKLRKPIVYDGPLNMTSLKNFVNTGSPVFELTAETALQFVKDSRFAIIKLYRSSSPCLDDDFIAYDYMLQQCELDLLVGRIDLDVEKDVEAVINATRPLDSRREEKRFMENIRLTHKPRNMPRREPAESGTVSD